ncbi:Wzz/FepE/Etk N-terminal domain-containing protein [Rhizobium mongolense]|uniref:Uncharacterized protein involved in exopolysaccharide biosynthesis/Mrp family chromosome partitioning ATPase n=2 Tax=Rhizobium mongolense TaxID=57676 RepID=A0ABR6IWD8_9HYPH|nr:Wzz/FepE/Etk N-terminal domain-containing protein [Rhizobium mongolense]MBB4231980.1 uncharacterized protein involved in exopolysaccharide biosynthesis/Mrp family chromosome partitioning ATPase [Rhizobium mongolense]TVZ66928.1 uncharacterized protein involved in exopolysaccharide biosynthesis [Rhizobium mongolense USDA 1844]
MVVHDIGKLIPGDQFGKKQSPGTESISFGDIWRFLRRHTLMLAFFTAIGAGAGAIYVSTTQPTFFAAARLVMDPEQGQIASQDAFTGTIIIEAAEIASQVEIIKSEPIAKAVINKLNLYEDPEIQDNTSWRSIVKGWIKSVISKAAQSDGPGQKASNDEIRMRRTMASFLSRVSVVRVGQSYILEIGYRSADPQKAARAANALAQAYMDSTVASRAAAARSGANWLETRLIDVEKQAREAALDAEEFRAKNGIMDLGTTASLDQQQLSEISSQAMAASAETAAASAKLETLDRLMSGEAIGGSVQETIDNPRIQKLQEDVSLATARLNTLVSRYDPGNPAIAAARDEVARLTGEIRNEFVRVQEVYETNLQVAQARERLLNDQMAALTATGTDKNLARVKLTEMESRATTYRRIYESILQQLTGTLQKQSFPLGDSRIVTAASAPLTKSSPKPSIILPFTTLAGLAGGLLLALLIDGRGRGIHLNPRLRQELGIPSLGSLPLQGAAAVLPAGAKGANLSTAMPLRYVLDAPYSDFTEALRGVKNSIGSPFRPNSPMVIGITSVGSGEGKTTVAANLAQLYQNEGTPVVLVDADFQKGFLSKVASAAGEDFGLGLLRMDHVGAHEPHASEHVVAGHDEHGRRSRRNRDDEHAEPSTLVPVLTVEETRRSAACHQIFGHLAALKTEIELLRQNYGVVIVDLAAFESSADTRHIFNYLDGIAIVVGKPKKMTIERLSAALASFGTSRMNLLGIIANRSGGRKRSPGKPASSRPSEPGVKPAAPHLALNDKPRGRPLKVAVAIASSGRREILSAVLPHISHQTRQPEEVVICVPSLEDVDRTSLSSLACPVRVLVSERGLCLQRNTILDSIEADVVLFLDDDFLMTPTYIEDTELLFRTRRDIVMSTGTVIADGITGAGISVCDGLKLVQKVRRPQKREKSFKPIYNAYGCNMAVRVSAIVASGVRFDENLPFYGWLEDVDFSRMMARYGEVICADHLQGVHLGTKTGRTTGIKFGYSQIANPIYLVRKNTLSSGRAAAQMGRNLAANLFKAWRPEPWVDRKGRLRGNAIAIFDLLMGRLAPQNIRTMG